eukprot:s1725_g13.t1
MTNWFCSIHPASNPEFDSFFDVGGARKLYKIYKTSLINSEKRRAGSEFRDARVSPALTQLGLFNVLSSRIESLALAPWALESVKEDGHRVKTGRLDKKDLIFADRSDTWQRIHEGSATGNKGSAPQPCPCGAQVGGPQKGLPMLLTLLTLLATLLLRFNADS